MQEVSALVSNLLRLASNGHSRPLTVRKRRASAGIVLVRVDPGDIARIIALSQATYRKMVQNL